MKILAIERSGLFYGSAINLNNWIKKYISEDQAHIDVLLGENGEISKELEGSGAKVIISPIPEKANKYGKKSIKGINVFINFLYLLVYNFKTYTRTKKEYDYIVFNNYRTSIYYLPLLCLYRLFSNSKIILRLQISQTPIKLLLRMVHSLVHEVIIHGTEGYSKREFPKYIYDSKKVVCIPNPVNTDKFIRNEKVGNTLREKLGIKSDAFVVLSVCYIEPRKGVLQLVRVFKKANLDNSVLVHVGDHGSHEDYYKEILSLKTENTIFLGKRNDVSDLYSIADLFVLNSEYEGMPYVIVEAMSSSLPILSTFAGSNEEVVTARNGKLIEYNNNELLEKELKYFRDNKNIASEMGQASRIRVIEEYSEKKYFQSLSEIFK
ncbi:glycosyltransferase family 4 protein [Alteromonas sp. NFXS44]|uniref:glycosyltransferase family 4 protein n=1 Tax=Alteromonas sp. NFXS44 TaxID=2818435 RepID=UPI0032DED0E3